MEIFKIEVQEFLARVVEVKANSIQNATSKVSDLYKKEKIVLDYNDFVKVEFIDADVQNIKEEKNILLQEIIDYLFEDEKNHFEEFEIAPEDHIFLKLNRLKEISNF